MKRTKPGLVTRAEAARRLKIPPAKLDKCIQRGAPGLASGPRGSKRYDVAKIAAWLARRPVEDGTRLTVSEARTRLLTTQRELGELKLAVQRGELISAKAEDRRDFEMARTIRDSVLNVPDRIASELAAEGDAGRVHARLTDELTKCLTALADVLEHGPEPAIDPTRKASS